MMIKNGFTKSVFVLWKYGKTFVVGNSSGKGTMSSLFVSPLALAGHLCWLAAQVHVTVN